MINIDQRSKPYFRRSETQVAGMNLAVKSMAETLAKTQVATTHSITKSWTGHSGSLSAAQLAGANSAVKSMAETLAKTQVATTHSITKSWTGHSGSLSAAQLAGANSAVKSMAETLAKTQLATTHSITKVKTAEGPPAGVDLDRALSLDLTVGSIEV